MKEKLRKVETQDILKLPTLTCQRCGNTWIPRTENPKNCPKCHTPYWNKPRKREVKK